MFLVASLYASSNSECVNVIFFLQIHIRPFSCNRKLLRNGIFGELDRCRNSHVLVMLESNYFPFRSCSKELSSKFNLAAK
jgi:hypothetical protein